MADVQKSAFMLSSATIMMAPAFTTSVYDLTPDLHSVGMVREVSISVDSSLIELKNGIAQSTVASRRTGLSTSLSATIFEMTAANFLRSNALDPASAVVAKRGVLAAAAGAAAVSLSVTSDPIPGDAASAITAIGDIPAGSTILIQRVGEASAYVFPTTSSGVATGAGPYAVPIAGSFAIPAGMSFPAGSRVWIVTKVPVAHTELDQLFGVKVVGTLDSYERPVVAVFPKCRVVKGFQLSFTETDYGSMPWEMMPLLLSKGEAAGRLADIGTSSPCHVFIGA